LFFYNGEEMSGKVIISNEFPVICLTSEAMPLPGIITNVRLGDQRYDKLLEETGAGMAPLALCLMVRPIAANYPDKFYEIGMVAEIKLNPDSRRIVELRGWFRAKAEGFRSHKGNLNDYYLATLGRPIKDLADDAFEFINDRLEPRPEDRVSIAAFLFDIKDGLKKLIRIASELENVDIAALDYIVSKLDGRNFDSYEDIDQFIWEAIASLPHMLPSWKQRFIESTSLGQRIIECLDYIYHNLRLAKLRNKIQENLSDEETEETEDNNQKIPHLIKKSREAPIKDGQKSRLDNERKKDNEPSFKFKNPELAERFKRYLEIRDSIKDPKEKTEFGRAAIRDFKALKSFGETIGDKTEVAMIINRLDLTLSLPWGKEAPINKNLSEFKKIFESEHFGLEKAEEEVSEFVAVKIQHANGKARILCFVGPPGVGKTSVCKSVAHGLGLEYVIISLGGVRDEADIRGHRVTYIGARPGRIISELKNVGSKNIVFVLDEIDKIGFDTFRGDPSAALLEVLDPEQNHSFTDHYLEAPFDLSKVFFICTANTVVGILPALKDRMDIIPFSGYTEDQKVQIAKRFLVPKAFAEVGLKTVDFSEEVLLKIIGGYTKESGVRDLERKLAKIARKIVKDNLENPGYAEKLVIGEELVEMIHGRPKYLKGRANATVVGEAIGLYVNEVGGGDITYVQAQLSIKTGIIDKSISQTDEAGEALYKSNQRAVDVIKSKIENIPDFIKKLKSHLVTIQVSDDFSPVDGPSAGVAVVVAIYSKLTGQVVKPYIAMTGAIALLGRVKAVGGIKEKVIAAVNAGVKEIILPESNRKDFDEDVPQSAKSKLNQAYFVEDIDQVLEIVFLEDRYHQRSSNPVQ